MEATQQKSSRLELLTFKVEIKGNLEKIGINIFKVQEIINLPHINRLPLKSEEVLGTINIRGDVIAVLDTKKILCNESTDLSKNPLVIVCQSVNTRVALLIEQIDEIYETSWEKVQAIEGIVKSNDYVVGIVTVGEDLISILNLEYLMVSYLKNEEKPEHIKLKKDLSNCKILVVDDSMWAQKVITQGLVNNKISSEGALDGLQALEKIKSYPSNHFNLILCDIEMPKMDGYSFLESIKSLSEYKDIPVVMYSSLSDDISIEKAKKMGAKHYVTKYDLSKLLEAVTDYAT